MLQESLTNVTKYAQASTVWVACRRDGDDWRLTVRDDGVGFVLDAANQAGFGLLGMRDAEGVDITTRADPGTTGPAHIILSDPDGNGVELYRDRAEADWPRFASALQQVAAEWLQPAALQRCLATDGPLGGEWFNTATVATLDAQVWGQGFEATVFCDEVDVLQQRLVGEKHLKLVLKTECGGQTLDGIAFNIDREVWPNPTVRWVELAYKLDVNEYRGQETVQLLIAHIQPR